MKIQLIFHHLAERELNDAAQYYEGEGAGLGHAFLNEVERAVGLILEHPEAASVVRGVVRRILLRRFPYGVLYSIKPDGIRILAIMNLKRRPTYWVGRR